VAGRVKSQKHSRQLAQGVLAEASDADALCERSAHVAHDPGHRIIAFANSKLVAFVTTAIP